MEQTEKQTTDKEQCPHIKKKIGRTTYNVAIHFSKTSRETMTDKINRLMFPTEDRMKLITILSDVVKSPKLTADWENELTLVSKGEVTAEQFMSGIEAMVSDLVKTYHSVSNEQKAMFGVGKSGQEIEVENFIKLHQVM